MNTEQFASTLAFGLAIVAIGTVQTVFAKRILIRRAKVFSQYPSWALIPIRVLFMGADPLAVTPGMVFMSRLVGCFGIAVGLLVVTLTVLSERSAGSTLDLRQLFRGAAKLHSSSVSLRARTDPSHEGPRRRDA
jgi:hypothetical protein